MPLLSNLDSQPKYALACTAAVAACFCSFILADALRPQNLYTASAPAVQVTPVVSAQTVGYSRAEILEAARQAYEDEVAQLEAEEAASSTSSIRSAGLAALASSLVLAAAGLSLRVFSQFQSKPRHMSSIDLLSAAPIAMAAAASEKRGRKTGKEKKAEKKEKAARAPVVLSPREVMYKMRKGVLRLNKKPTKTTGRVCALLGKVDNRQARAISFSHIRTKRLQKVNLHWRRLYWEEAKCFVLLRLSTKGIKTITKYGLHQAAIKFGLDLTKHINGTSERKYIKYLPESEKKLALIRGASLRYKQAVRWAKLNDEELPEPPKSMAKATKAEAEPAVVAMAISHGCKVPQLSKPADQRKALLRSLTTELIRHGRIKTTLIRAKAVRKHVDHMITLAKGGSLHERRQALGYIYDKELVKTLFEQVPDRYATREGGYTRIIRTMPRKGDCAKMCYIELV